MRRSLLGLSTIAALALACGAALGACAPNLPSASFVGTDDPIRVLAIQAEPPDVQPGQPTTLTALIAQPRVPPPPAVSRLWLLCTVPPGTTTPLPCGASTDFPGASGGQLGAPSCSDRPDAPLCVLSYGADPTYTPPATVLGGAASAQLLVTLVAATGARGAVGCLQDVAASGNLLAEQASNPCQISLKRLDVSGTPTNHNPGFAAAGSFTLTGMGGTPQPLAGGSATFAPTASGNTLTATRADDASERKSDGSFEALSVSWFTTSGAIDNGRSLYLPPGCVSQADCATRPPASQVTTGWTAPTPGELGTTALADRVVDFWVVLRDDRGGVAWLTGSAAARP